MIRINNLEFGYKKKVKLFSELNLEMKKGKIYGLLGKNGAGKTTLLKQIAGLLYPNTGENLIDGIDSRKRHPSYLAKYYFVPEEFSMPPVKIERFLQIYSPFYPNFDTVLFYNYLKEFDLNTNNKLTKLSYGQKKKFLLSFGLAAQTPIFITDEPTNGLDIPSKTKFRKIMASALTKDRLFIISTHQVRDIEGLIDGIVVIDNGTITFNEALNTVSEKLIFKNINEDEQRDDILYSEAVLGGYKAILKNAGEKYTQPDMELLFNSIITQDSKVTELFKN